MIRTAENVFDKLVSMAWGRTIIGNPDDKCLQSAIRRGAEIPDKCLPGRLIMRLSDKERELLQGLTADMTQHRIYG